MIERPALIAPTYQSGQPIQPGDWVRVYASLYSVWHHGIVLRLLLYPQWTAVKIIHNTKGGGVAVADWFDFAEGNPVLLYRRPESHQHAEQVVARAAANLGEPYALFAPNCEHFASFSFYGEAASETVAHLDRWRHVSSPSQYLHRTKADRTISVS